MTTSPAPAIELIGIDKSFGPVHANNNVNLVVERGVIHGIVGENGAGKSTLMSILYGFYEADRGEIRVNGEPVRIRSSREAISHGIGMVHQHFMLVPPLSVLENVMLGAEGGPLLSEGAGAIRKRLGELGREYGLVVDPEAIVGELSVGLQQRVEILKALVRGAEILVLDEPTAVLTPAEADQLFEMLRVLKRENKTIIFITHKLREIMSLTDRVSVMRRGEMVATFDTASTSPPELADAMVGRKVILKVEKGPSHPGSIALEARNLVVRDDRGVARIDGVSFVLREGEILGVAGVAGNGQSELLEALAGIRALNSGEVLIEGEPIPAHERNPHTERLLGVGHVPEDRHRVGLVMPFEACESAMLGFHREPVYGKGFFYDRSAIVVGRREEDGRIRRPPACAVAQDRQFLRRQPAEDRAGARDRTQSEDPARRAANSGRRHRRDRIHPQAHRRSARRRQGGAPGLGRTRRDLRALRPHHRALRRPHHRGAPARGDQRPGPRALDGGRERARRMSAPLKPLPAWADVALIPLVNVAAAFVISGFVVLAIGENPLEAVQSLVLGALGDLEGIGYTLFYATSFIFTGLSVAICFHAGLFNIGTEGQAYIGGLGAALVALHFGFLPGYTLAIAAIIGAAVFGAAFAAIPGYLQAYRDSHIVITTIMFNYIASAIMGYLLVNVLRKPGQMNAETTPFRDTALVPQFHEVLAHFGITWPVTPFNLSFLLALLCCLAVWLLIWRTRLGYEIRTVGANPTAAVYGGISPARVTVITTLLSGALAGGVAANIILGDQHRLILEFVGGFGFVGIAVALMGRAHPVGIILAAILFGVLYQGGQALSIDMPKISRDMIVVIQGLVVLFAGALEHMFRRPVATLLARRTTQPPI